MITLNNNDYIKLSKQIKSSDIATLKGINGFYKKNKISIFIYDLTKSLKYAIRLNDGMVCRASKLENGKTWYQYHLSNSNFNGFVSNSELQLLRNL